MVDTVANRALIPKITNLKIGAKPPSKYLNELREKNSKLGESLRSHKIDDELILNEEFDDMFEDLIRYRAQAIFDIIERIAIDPLARYLPPQAPVVSEYRKRHGEMDNRMTGIPDSHKERRYSTTVRLPVIADYRQRGSTEVVRFEATLLLNTSQPSESMIDLKGNLLKPSPAGLAMIHSVNHKKKALNGWTFWKLIDPERDKLRAIGELRSDERLVSAVVSHYG